MILYSNYIHATFSYIEFHYCIPTPSLNLPTAVTYSPTPPPHYIQTTFPHHLHTPPTHTTYPHKPKHLSSIPNSLPHTTHSFSPLYRHYFPTPLNHSSHTTSPHNPHHLSTMPYPPPHTTSSLSIHTTCSHNLSTPPSYTTSPHNPHHLSTMPNPPPHSTHTTDCVSVCKLIGKTYK